jgi:hypothetical protein
MQLKCVTLTGADDSILPEDLVALSRDFPFVEFGILFCRTFQGRRPGFPSEDWLRRLIKVTEQGQATLLSGHEKSQAPHTFAGESQETRSPSLVGDHFMTRSL